MEVGGGTVLYREIPNGKCPKNWQTKVSDKMAYANSVDPDQTVCHPIKYFKKQLHKKQNLDQKIME